VNLKSQYSIIGGSTSAFVIVIVLLSLLQSPGSPVPVLPIGEQIISNQTNDGGNDSDGDGIEEIIEQIFVAPTIEEIPIETEQVPDEVPESNSVRSSRSGGGSSNNDEESTYGLELFEDENESDGAIDLGQDVDAVASTDNNDVEEVIFRWKDPTNEVAKTEIIPLDSGSATSTFEPDELGNWVVEADFGNGEVLQEDLNVSYLVIPESPIGIIALIGASAAAFGGYALLRGRSN
jgi:hypothetical protein